LLTVKHRSWVFVLACFLLSGCVMHVIDRMTGEDEARQIRKTGTPAMAQVLDLRDTGMTLNQNPVVSLRIMVHPEGAPPFEAKMKALVGRLDIPRVQPGATLPVKYDPNDHARVALDIYEEK
jgi:hypothetical protein